MSSGENIPSSILFLTGGIAGMAATCIVQPLDLLKNRMQLHSTKVGVMSVAYTIAQKEGYSAFYSGLSAGLFRQCTYTTARLGINTWLTEYFSKDGQPNLIKRLMIGSIAGGIGAFIGTPAEVALIRMTADGRLPVAERRNYKNVFNALNRIVNEEGILALWRGTRPTIARAMVLNAVQLGSYYHIKNMLIDSGYFESGFPLFFVGSMISGFATTCASMPFDIAKTRIQNMKIVDGKPEFKSGIDVVYRLCRNEGLFSLWKGFFPYYGRLGPHTVLTFSFYEALLYFSEKYLV